MQIDSGSIEGLLLHDDPDDGITRRRALVTHWASFVRGYAFETDEQAFVSDGGRLTIAEVEWSTDRSANPLRRGLT